MSRAPGSPLRSAGFIAWRDFVYLIRQRETLLWTFVMPILFFYFIGTVTGGMAAPAEDRPDLLALRAPADSGFLVDELVTHLEAQGFEVRRPETDEEFHRYGRRLRIPEPPEGHRGLTAAVLAGEPMALEWGRSGDGPAVQFDRVRVNRAVYGLLADLIVVRADESGEPATAGDFRRLAGTPRALRLRVEPAGERLVAPEGYEQTIPGITVMFTMLVMLTSGSILLVIERRQGLLRRLAATPLGRGTVVAGKLGARMGLGVIQVAFGMAAGTVLFGMDWGESLWMIVLILFAWALFNAALGMLLGNLSRSEAQVTGVGIVVTMVLAALGGCWWPIEVTPAWMQQLALALPTGWAMDAMHRLISFGYAPATAAPHLAALLTGAVLLAWGAARTFRYQ